jgi:hypothetical protein
VTIALKCTEFTFYVLFCWMTSYFSSYSGTTTPCEFWFSAPVHTRLFRLRRDISNTSLLISLNHVTSRLSIHFWTPFGTHSYGTPLCNLPRSFRFFSILLRRPHHFFLCAVFCLTIHSPLIHFSISAVWNAPYIILIVCLWNTSKLITSPTENVHVSQPYVTTGLIMPRIICF